MVERSTAATHAPAKEAVERARLMHPFSIATAARRGVDCRPAPPPVAKPLRGKACDLGAAAVVKDAAHAEN